MDEYTASLKSGPDTHKVEPNCKHAWSINNNTTAPRAMAVLKPLKIQITNFASKYPTNLTYLEVRDFAPDTQPDNTSTHLIPFERLIYIDQSDFVEGHYEHHNSTTPGLSMGHMVGLLHTDYAIEVTRIVRSSADINVVECLEVVCYRVDDLETPPDTFIHWVSALGNFKCEVRLMKDVPGGDICNPGSGITISEAFVDVSVKYGKPGDRFYFERVGVFSVDSASRIQNLVFNQVV